MSVSFSHMLVHPVIGITKKEKGHGRGTRRGWKEHEERVRGICNVSLRLARKKNPEDCPGSCRLKSSHLGKCKVHLGLGPGRIGAS